MNTGSWIFTPYLKRFRQELVVAVNDGSSEPGPAAQRLPGPLVAAVELAFLKTLTWAMDESNRGAADGRSGSRGDTPGGVPVAYVTGLVSSLGTTGEVIEAISSAPVSDAQPGPSRPGSTIRLTFVDPAPLAGAVALFGPDVWEDGPRTLRMSTDGSVRALRAVLSSLDEADLEVAAITVHSAALGDVFSALAGEPRLAGPQDHHA